MIAVTGVDFKMSEMNNGVIFCRFSSRGCSSRFSHRQKRENHERIGCDFRPFPCPLKVAGTSKCYWEGESNQIAPHLENEHSDSVVTVTTPLSVGGGLAFFFKLSVLKLRNRIGFSPKREEEDATFPDANFEEVVVSLGRCFEEYFYLHLRPSARGASFLRLAGTRKRSRSFVYKLEMRKHHRRLTWEARPLSAFDHVRGEEETEEGPMDDEEEASLARLRPLSSTRVVDVDSHVDVENLIWLEPKTLSSFADEDGYISVRLFLQVETKFQRSGWSRFETCEKCAQWDAIDTDYVFLKLNGNGAKP